MQNARVFIDFIEAVAVLDDRLWRTFLPHVLLRCVVCFGRVSRIWLSMFRPCEGEPILTVLLRREYYYSHVN